MKNRKTTTTTVIKLSLKILSNVRGLYLYSRAKPRGIILSIMHKGLVQFLLLKVLNNDVRSDANIRNFIVLLSDDNK